MESVNVYDIAVLLSILDLPYMKERQLIQMLYTDLQLQQSFDVFELQVDEQLEQLDAQVVKDLNDLVATKKIMKQAYHFEADMAHYLKVIRLRLVYAKEPFVRMKLRTLLRQLGYKRRSEALMDKMKGMLDTYGLVVYKKGEELALVNDVSLDEFIMIRLRGDEVVKRND